MSGVSERLQAAYAATHYRITVPGQEFILLIGVRSDELARLHAHFGVQRSAYLTAWNPGSRPVTLAQNQKANTALANDLTPLAVTCFPGEGVDPTGACPPEEAFLALGISKEQASDLGRKYNQNAIVWIGVDAMPELVMLR